MRDSAVFLDPGLLHEAAKVKKMDTEAFLTHLQHAFGVKIDLEAGETEQHVKHVKCSGHWLQIQQLWHYLLPIYPILTSDATCQPAPSPAPSVTQTQMHPQRSAPVVKIQSSPLAVSLSSRGGEPQKSLSSAGAQPKDSRNDSKESKKELKKHTHKLDTAEAENVEKSMATKREIKMIKTIGATPKACSSSSSTQAFSKDKDTSYKDAARTLQSSRRHLHVSLACTTPASRTVSSLTSVTSSEHQKSGGTSALTSSVSAASSVTSSSYGHRSCLVDASRKPTTAASDTGNKKSADDTCTICMCPFTNPKTLDKCKHTFCKECIDVCFKKMKPACPVCGEIYGEITGNQPEGCTMKHYTEYHNRLPGYEACGTIVINYRIPGGTQGVRTWL